MTRYRLFVCTSMLCLVVALTERMWAHHSVAARYDVSRAIALTGELVAVEWRNPHVHLELAVVREDGGSHVWVFEGPSPSFFRERSISKEQFERRIDSRVTIEAFPAKDGSSFGAVIQVSFPDGTEIDVDPQD